MQRKLTHSFATDIIVRTLLPWNLPALVFTDTDRSDLLADSFKRHLFSRRGKVLTFGDLRPDRPRLLVNATDLQSGRKFIFTNEAFDGLNSDLSKYPIADAVAASSAVPVLLHHVTLRDYSTVFKQYRHLIDGGIVDNLGVQSLVETYAAHVDAAAAAKRPDPYPRGAVLFVLDARTEFDAALSDRGDTGFLESFVMGAGLTTTALLNRASSATLAEIIVRYSADDITAKDLRAHIDTLNRTGDLLIKDRNGKPVRVVHLALSRVKDVANLPYTSFGHNVNSIQTYFNISATEAFNLWKASELLVREKFERELSQIRKRPGKRAAAAESRRGGRLGGFGRKARIEPRSHGDMETRRTPDGRRGRTRSSRTFARLRHSKVQYRHPFHGPVASASQRSGERSDAVSPPPTLPPGVSRPARRAEVADRPQRPARSRPRQTVLPLGNDVGRTNPLRSRARRNVRCAVMSCKDRTVHGLLWCYGRSPTRAPQGPRRGRTGATAAGDRPGRSGPRRRSETGQTP